LETPCKSRDFESSKASFNNGFKLSRTPFEKVHLIFYKHLLGTKNTSSNIGVRAELGRFPVEIVKSYLDRF
jgi:hypothetical protein